MTGANDVTISPNEKNIAFLSSYSNIPWELYLQENKPAAKPEQVTFKGRSSEFNSFSWQDPEIVTFKASDSATVYARLYKPISPDPLKPAVIFVHGAGYLQNAHKWWSSYFREYMFHNFLAAQGYYVLDIDYRGSAGYGRDWRTGIYRHMGGRDLSDQLDGKKFLVDHFGIDPKRVGMYGGSYGGFLTLMAMFTTPDAFAAGAALRPVTDWANYNNGYTSNILNEPYNDSLAYHRSSPYYFAGGLKGHLLICHGMVDLNVNYQDAVKLSQRLIELGKDNWELASYPMEDHDFMDPSSWTDEYKRIFKLFETVLKRP
jgi:dipeptidyl aminopeptidase/acylaminoacyl peptidase